MREASQVLVMFFMILIYVAVKLLKIHQTVHLRFVRFTICDSYLIVYVTHTSI